MTAMESLSRLVGFNESYLSNDERVLLEVDLFIRTCEELTYFFKLKYKDYFNLMKFTKKMEIFMLESNLIRWVILDILLSEEYNLTGIANYTQFCEEVIYDVALGQNLNPSLLLSRKIIELHRLVKPTLYQDILKKIAADFRLKSTYSKDLMEKTPHKE